MIGTIKKNECVSTATNLITMITLAFRLTKQSRYFLARSCQNGNKVTSIVGQLGYEFPTFNRRNDAVDGDINNALYKTIVFLQRKFAWARD